MVLATAHYQLNRGNASRGAPASGVKLTNTEFPSLDSGDLGGQWVDVIIAHLLLREAQGLIQPDGPPDIDVPKAAQP